VTRKWNSNEKGPLGRHVYTLMFIHCCLLFCALYTAKVIACQLACGIKIMTEGSEGTKKRAK